MLNDAIFRLHHVGLPTSRVRPNERFSAKAAMYTSESDSDPRVQWHRFLDSSPLPRAVRERAHIALEVRDLDVALRGETVLLAAYEPIDNYRIAIVEIEGTPIELVQTGLTDEELWCRAKAGAGSLYR